MYFKMNHTFILLRDKIYLLEFPSHFILHLFNTHMNIAMDTNHIPNYIETKNAFFLNLNFYVFKLNYSVLNMEKLKL